MRRQFQVISLLMAVLLTVLMPFSAMAGTRSNGVNYQAILDKLNAEYGTGARFATEKELAAVGMSKSAQASYLSMTALQFEIYMRTQIEAELKETAAANAAWEAIDSSRVVERGRLRGEKSSIEVQTSKTVTRYKSVTGARMYLEATVDNTPGYWVYKTIKSAWTEASSFPAFVGDEFDYNLIDSRRTCALKAYGYVVNKDGIITNNSASRYAEYWAGNGM